MLPNPEIFGRTIEWYVLFPKIGLLFSIVFGLWYYYKKAVFKLTFLQIFGFAITLFVIMVGAGRLVGYFENYLNNGCFSRFSFFFEPTSSGGFRWSGSLLGILLFLPFLSNKMLKIKYFDQVLDMLVLCFCVFTIFIKQACQFSGDGCYGIYTNLPWGMYYPYGIAPNILPVHPTPIYDSLFHLFFFAFLLNWDLKKKRIHGSTARLYFIIVPIFYILLEVIRLNPIVALGITLPQVVYIIILLVVIPRFRVLANQKQMPEIIELNSLTSNE